MKKIFSTYSQSYFKDKSPWHYDQQSHITVPDDYTVEEVAQVLMEHNISWVPVTDCNGKLVGIITRNDIFKILVDHRDNKRLVFQDMKA